MHGDLTEQDAWYFSHRVAIRTGYREGIREYKKERWSFHRSFSRKVKMLTAA
jgi:hypothetical protein